MSTYSPYSSRSSSSNLNLKDEFFMDFSRALQADNFNELSNLLKLDMDMVLVNENDNNRQNPKTKRVSTTNQKLLNELVQQQEEDEDDFDDNDDNDNESDGEEENLIFESFFDPNDDDETTGIWNSIAKNHLKVMKLVSVSKSSKAALKQVNSITLFLRVFTNSAQLPVLYTLASGSWNLASQSGSVEVQEQAARAINRLFIACITERAQITPLSRKWGTFKIGSLLLKIYFEIGQLNLIQNVIKALKACILPNISEFPPAHTITFNYFLGRYHLSREEFEEAEVCLVFCYEKLHCNDNENNYYKKNLKMILHLLIPIKLILYAAHPSDEFLSKTFASSSTNYTFYSQLIRFIGSGNVSSFKSLLKENSKFLLHNNTFIMYERLFYLVLRGLIRQIYTNLNNSTRIPLQTIHQLTEEGQYSYTLMEINCFVANLIGKGIIRGYISEEKQFLVLSAQNPFPTRLHGVL